MVENEWRLSAWRTLDELAGEGLSGTHGLARALVTCAILLKSAPRPTTRRDGYANEGRLKALTAAAKARLVADDFSAPRDDEGCPELFVVLAAQLGALDALHHEFVGDLAPADPNEDWLVEHAGGAAFLVPRGGLYRASEKGGGKKGQVVLKWRDLMPHHRILPTDLHGVAIELHWRDMAGGWPKGAQLGAGFFTDLSFVDDLPGAGEPPALDFLVTDVVCADQDEQIARLVAQAHESQCAGLVLPELTMPLDRVQMLQSFLRRRMQWAEPRATSGPGLVVAGSWHTPLEDGGEIANIAPVFDAYGEPVLRHAKLLAYNFLGAPERIVPGDRLHVLVTEEVLISFGICLDFCERQEDAPFPFLDIDYALVTSCGADVTMQGHIDTARDLITRFRSRAFVVQHRYPALEGTEAGQVLGYVLPPRDDDTVTPAKTLTTAAFSVHETD